MLESLRSAIMGSLILALAGALLVAMLLFAYKFQIQGKPELLDCENMRFGDKMGYYACVQAREIIFIREAIENHK